MSVSPATGPATEVQTLLLVDDDAETCAGLGELLYRDGRHLIICRDLESAQIAIEHYAVTDVLTDVKLSGAFRFEGLEIIDFLRRRASNARVMIMTGQLTDELDREARRRGAIAALQKPFSVDDLEDVIGAPIGDTPGLLTIIPTLDDILDDLDSLVPVYQPLVWTETPQHAVGFEALTRLQSSSPFANPEVLFRYAHMKGRILDLELAAASRSLSLGRDLAQIGFVSINLHPHTFADADRLCDGVMNAAAEAAVSPERLVLEITEQSSLPDLALVEAIAATLRTHGVRFAFDDVGSAYSHLSAIAVVRPAYLKISQHFGTACEADPVHRKIVENVESLARSFASEVVLEGIETEQTATFARDLGIRFGQGFYYSRPASADRVLERYRSVSRSN